MTKNEKIKQWLTGSRDYFTGIALYQEFGQNPRFKTLVFTVNNNSPAVTNQLAYELEKLIDKSSLVIEKKKSLPKSPRKLRSAKEILFSSK